MKARFNLKNRTSDPALIVLKINLPKLRFSYSTGEHVPQKFWNAAKGRAQAVRQFPQHFELNRYLDHLELVSLNAIRQLKTNGQPLTRNNIRSAIDQLLNKQEPGAETLASYMFLMSDRKMNSGLFAKATRNTYHNAAKRLIAFNDPGFQDISLDWLYDFLEFMASPLKQYSKNTIHKTVKIIKAAMNEALESGLHNNTAHQSKYFTAPSEEVYNVYLTIQELQQLYKLKLDSSKLNRARNLFLLGAFTGLRFNEYANLSPENIRVVKGKQVIHFLGKKEDSEVIIPLHPVVSSILVDNHGRPPKGMSNQKINQYIKEVCQLAGLDELIPIRTTIGKVRIEKFPPKYELVKSHTARRSFATNAYLSGIPERSIMAMLGIKSLDTFQKYIKAGAHEHAILVRQFDFFQGDGFMRVV